jgi:hypothetical protein
MSCLALVVSRSWRFALPFLSPLLALSKPLAKAEGLPKKFEDMRAVRQSVQQPVFYPQRWFIRIFRAFVCNLDS